MQHDSSAHSKSNVISESLAEIVRETPARSNDSTPFVIPYRRSLKTRHKSYILERIYSLRRWIRITGISKFGLLVKTEL